MGGGSNLFNHQFSLVVFCDELHKAARLGSIISFSPFQEKSMENEGKFIVAKIQKYLYSICKNTYLFISISFTTR